jgi:two-component system, OmpR family, phosphate regulon sensor histidine kinase PhoR
MDERTLARKAEVAELLLNAARQLGESLEPERVYDRFHELLEDVAQHDGLVVSSYDENDDLIRCDYAWVEGNVIDAATLPPLPLNRTGGGMQSRVIVSGEPLLFNDVVERVQQDGEFYNVDREGTIEKIPDSGPAGTSAAMMLPVKHEGRVVGVVQVMADDGTYSEEQLELVGGLVAQMAAAVRNARLQKDWRRLEAAEAAARAAAAEWEQAAQVLDAVGDGIFLLDPDGVVRLWNRAAETVTGLTVDDVCDQPLADALPGWPTLAAAIPIAEADGGPRAVTLPVEIGGRDLWLSFIAVRGVSGVVYAFRDMTSERRLEEEKADFVATISHELRTPMAAVYGAAETLRRRDDVLTDLQRRQLVDMIAAQAARLTQITEEVLLTNRLDRGELEVARQPVDLGALVETTVEAMTAHTHGTPPVAVEVEAGAIASGDADRIQQVLVNLIDNAVKYGDDTTVIVRVESGPEAVRVVVTDAGPGILPADRELIFEKFYRGDPQLTHAPGGTGLGLYISRELARRMGASLDLDLGHSDGASFVLEFPRS